MKIIAHFLVGVLAILATLIVGFKDEIFYREDLEANGTGVAPTSSELKPSRTDSKKLATLSIAVGKSPIYDSLTGAFLSVNHVKNEHLEFYRINWSNDNNRGSEAIKERSRVTVGFGNKAHTIFIHSINKETNSVQVSISRSD